MVNLSCGHAIHALEPLVANSWEVHVGSLFRDLNALELSIVEIIRVVYVLGFCWISLIFQSTEVFLVELTVHLCCEGLFWRMLEPNLVVAINCLGRSFCETLSIQVLTLNLRNIARVSWNMLRLKLVSGTTDPSLSSGRMVAELEVFAKIG